MGPEINEAVPPAASRRTFRRVYHTMLAVFTGAVLCLPVLIPVSYWLLGFDPAVAHEYTVESFQAVRATAPLRRGFMYALFALGLVVLVLSAAALVRWLRGKRDVHPLVASGTLIAAAALVFVLFAAMITPTVVLCC